MSIEDSINSKLLIRGFTKEQLLNNRGLIGATIDETLLLNRANDDKMITINKKGYYELLKKCNIQQI